MLNNAIFNIIYIYINISRIHYLVSIIHYILYIYIYIYIHIYIYIYIYILVLLCSIAKHTHTMHDVCGDLYKKYAHDTDTDFEDAHSYTGSCSRSGQSDEMTTSDITSEQRGSHL